MRHLLSKYFTANHVSETVCQSMTL